MRTDKGYRFNIQFNVESPEQQQVGEFLERLGSKKSRLIVDVLCEYLNAHPQALEPGSRIQLGTAGLTKEEIRAIIREELARGAPAQPLEPAEPAPAASEDAVDAMLENLGIFG